MKQLVFLSYDLGFQGDYSKLYRWLDEHNALECGDSSCRFIYEFKNVENNNDEESTRAMIKEIKEDIISQVDFLSTNRVYIASDFFWKGVVALNGLFIVGKRKPSNPWDGASGNGDNQIMIDE